MQYVKGHKNPNPKNSTAPLRNHLPEPSVRFARSRIGHLAQEDATQ